MRVLAAVFWGVVIAGFGGCTPSLHSLIGEKDAVLEPGLIGSWGEGGDQEGEETWQFEKAKGNSYNLIFTDTNQKARSTFQVRLARIGSRLFFDATLVKKTVNGVEADDSALVTPHWFGRCSIQGDSLRYALLDQDWLRQAIAADKVQVRHEVLDDETIVLTASTGELQSLAQQLADDENAFPWSEPLVRR